MSNLEYRAKIISKQIFNGYYDNFPDKFKELGKFGAYLCDRSTQIDSSPNFYVVTHHKIYHFPEGITAVAVVKE